jgi:mannose-1-phosphate guanylyltransferase
MKAILLSAGLGTRLAPLTNVLPKCLMPIHGRPLLEHWLRRLDAAGVTDILVNTHHLPQLVEGWLAAGPWAGRVRVAHETRLLGTGGTLAAHRNLAGGGPLLLAHADNLCCADFGEFFAAHARRAPSAVMTMMSFTTDCPRSCGILELDEAGVVRAFHEKEANPPGNLANAAVYVVEPEVADFVAGLGREVVDFSTEVIPHFLGRIQSWRNVACHRDIGSVGSLLAAQAEFPGHVRAGEASGPDAWGDLCIADGHALPRRLAGALARALGLPLVRPASAELAVEALAGQALVSLPAEGDLDRVFALLHKNERLHPGAFLFMERSGDGPAHIRTCGVLGLDCFLACDTENHVRPGRAQ